MASPSESRALLVLKLDLRGIESSQLVVAFQHAEYGDEDVVTDVEVTMLHDTVITTFARAIQIGLFCRFRDYTLISTGLTTHFDLKGGVRLTFEM